MKTTRKHTALLLADLALASVLALPGYALPQQPPAKKRPATTVQKAAPAAATAATPSTAPSQAADAPPPAALKVWAQEPESFMGLKFGQPLVGQLQPCPKNPSLYSAGVSMDDFDRINREHIYCYSTKTSTKYPETSPPPAIVNSSDFPGGIMARNMPDIGIGRRDMELKVLDGKIEGGTYYFSHADYGKVVDVFLARYGEPTATETVPVQNLGGASFDNREMSWRGKNVTIVLDEYSSTIKASMAFFYTATYGESLNKKRTDNVEKFKGNL